MFNDHREIIPSCKIETKQIETKDLLVCMQINKNI